MRRWLAVAMTLPMFAQTPAFDVVSVKPSPPDGRYGFKPLPGGKFVATSLSLRSLIALAFTGFDDQFEGVPKWADDAKYDINAQAGREVEMYEMQQMLQSLLLDRFKLVINRETRQMSVYDLVVAKGGPKLRPADPSRRPDSSSARGKFTGIGCSLPWLVASLTPIVHRHVIDKTGLDGRYDFTLEYDPSRAAAVVDEAASASSGAPSIFTALEGQLGLKLVPTKGPIDVFIIQHIERPSEN
jgi:uncharacterized protein (TIGR03435 family)